MKSTRIITLTLALAFVALPLSTSHAQRTHAPTLAVGESPAVSSHEGVYRLPTGGLLLVAGEGEDVRVRAVGQDAINLMYNASYEGADELDLFNQRAEQIVTGLASGDTKALHKVFSASRRERGEQDLQRYMNILIGAYGPLERFTVHGTLPRADTKAHTYVDLDFERASQTVCLVWRGEELVTMHRDHPVTFGIKARPASAATYAATDVRSGKPIMLTFEGSADGMSQRLRFEGPQSAVAQRDARLAAK